MWMSDAGTPRAFCVSETVVQNRIASWAKRPSLGRDNTLAAHLTATASLVRGFAMCGGIYQIKNQINGKRYIGSAVNLKRRWQNHLSSLCGGRHYNPHLQSAFDKEGETAFVFSVLEHVQDSAKLIEREQHHLDTLAPEYNMCPTAGNTLGRLHSLDTCRRMSETRMGHYVSPETCRKLSEASRGKHPTEETRRKISEASKRRRATEQTRQKTSEAMKQWWQRNPGERARMSKAMSGEGNPNYGKPLSEEQKRKMSSAMSGRQLSEEHKRKMSEAQKGRRAREKEARRRGLWPPKERIGGS